MKAEEKKALGSSNSASGDAELVSVVLKTVNGENVERRKAGGKVWSSGRRALTVTLRFRSMPTHCA